MSSNTQQKSNLTQKRNSCTLNSSLFNKQFTDFS